MTCKACQKNYKFTYNMTLRCCQIRWLRNQTKEDAQNWLRKYREEHGEPAMLDLISEYKAGNEL